MCMYMLGSSPCSGRTDTRYIVFVLRSGGAGGKGVWGKLGSESDGVDEMDRNDPNYDSDTLDNGDIELKCIIPELSDEELKVSVNG